MGFNLDADSVMASALRKLGYKTPRHCSTSWRDAIHRGANQHSFRSTFGQTGDVLADGTKERCKRCFWS
jgi:hypothetical protein